MADDLVAMGFPRALADDAIRTCGNVDRALTWLLEGNTVDEALPLEGAVLRPNVGDEVSVRVNQIWCHGVTLGSSDNEAQIQYVDGLGNVVQGLFPLSELGPPGNLVSATSAQEEQKGDGEVVSSIPFLFPLRKLEVGIHLDFQLSTGKWVDAVVVELSGLSLTLEVDDSGLKTTLSMNLILAMDRMADSGDMMDTGAGKEFMEVSLGMWVSIWAGGPSPYSKKWTHGEVVDISGTQAHIKYEDDSSTMRYHWASLRIGGVRREVCSIEDVSLLETLSMLEPEHFHRLAVEGGVLRVLDSRGLWCMAEVKRVTRVGGTKMLIHYDNWASKYDEWISADWSGEARLREMYEVDANPSSFLTEEAHQQQLADGIFTTKMNSHLLDIYVVSPDGNCLYRAVAHQVYGDVSLHEVVREDCFQFMLDNAVLFDTFCSEPIDIYVAGHRRLGEWGGHVELVCMSLMYNRPILVYQQDQDILPKPTHEINVDKDPSSLLPVIRLSYHGKSHYNSVVTFGLDHSPTGQGTPDDPIILRNL